MRDRRKPPVRVLRGLQLPYQKMRQQRPRPPVQLLQILLAQILDCFGDVPNVAFTHPSRAQQLRVALRPLEEILVVESG